MRILIKIVILMVFSTPALTQINLAVFMGNEYYENNGYDFSTNWGIYSFYNSNEMGSFGLKIKLNQTSAEFLAPTGAKKIKTFITDYTFIYGYRILKNFYSINLEPQMGFGLRRIDKEGYTTSLGAFGKRDIPATRNTYFNTIAALMVSYTVLENAHIFLIPQISAYGFKNMSKSYSVIGGIGVTFK